MDKKERIHKGQIVESFNKILSEIDEIKECIQLITNDIKEKNDLGAIKLKDKEEYKRVLESFNKLENVYSYLNSHIKDKVYLSYILSKGERIFKNNQSNLLGGMLANILITKRKKEETDYTTILNVLDLLELEILIEVNKVGGSEKEDVFKISLYGKYFKEPQITLFTTYTKDYFKTINPNTKQIEEAYTRFLEEYFETTIVDLLKPIVKETKTKHFSILSLDEELQKILVNTNIFDKVLKSADN